MRQPVLPSPSQSRHVARQTCSLRRRRPFRMAHGSTDIGTVALTREGWQAVAASTARYTQGMVLRVLLKGRPRAALGKVKRRLLRRPAQPAAPAPPAKKPSGGRQTKFQALPGDRLLTKPVFVL